MVIITKQSLNLVFEGMKRKRVDGFPKYGVEIADSVDFGELVIVNEGFTQPTRIDEDVWINHLCVIGHDAHIERGVILGAGVKISGHVVVKEYAFVCAGSIIQPHRVVGRGSMIGTLSNVNRDIPDFVIAYGNPCKVVRENTWRHPELE